MNRTAHLVAAALFVSGLGLGVAAASEPTPVLPQAPATPVTVTNFNTRGPVSFDHAKHVLPDLTCATCHHGTAGGEARCGTCHLVEATEKTPKIKDAMHGKDGGACFSCHTRKEAPHKLKCADCHQS